MAKSIVKANPKGFSRAISPPQRPVPAGACDCQMHIAGPYTQYPLSSLATLDPPPAFVSETIQLMDTLGFVHNVVVQPSFYARDNACTLEPVARLGDRARAVVVIDPDTSQADVQRMHEQGARGVRMHTIAGGGVSFDALEAMAALIAPFGWHLQLWLDARDLPDIADRLQRLPVDVVFDHMLNVDPASGIDEPSFKLMLDLLATGHFWVKLSNGRFAPESNHARRIVAFNPERVVWGSDWPHVFFEGDPPDDGMQLDRLWGWVPNGNVHRAILIDNPGRFYFED